MDSLPTYPACRHGRGTIYRAHPDGARFFHEARLASQVKHPNTVYVTDFGTLADGRPYLVMEYLAGRTLDVVHKEGPLEPRRAANLALQIVRGVRAIHKQGILHRDLKPHNVVLLPQDDGTEQAKIVDFGIAKNLHLPFQAEALRNAAATGTAPDLSPALSTQLTRMGEIVGTPAYLSPEQVTGEELDGRSDQYAIGCVLYAMLVGEPPFRHGSRVELMVMRLSVKPVSPRTRRPDAGISETLDAIVMRCLAVDRDDRFPRLRDLEYALEAELGLPHSVPPPSPRSKGGSATLIRKSRPGSRARRKARRLLVRLRPWLAPLVGLLSCFVIISGYVLIRPSPPEGPVTAAELPAVQRRAVETLTEQLQASGVELRVQALAGLGDTRDVRSFEAVRARLRDPEPEVVAQAARALGQLGDRRALPALSFALGEAKSGPVRVAVAEALRQLGDATGEATLHTAWTGTDAEARLAAALALCRREPAAAAQLKQIVGKLSGAQLGQAVACLASRGDEPALQQLRAQLDPGQPPLVRLAAVVRLLDAGGLPAADRIPTATWLRQVAHDPRAAPEPRLLALAAIGRLGDVRLDGRWLTRLMDQSPEPRLRVGSAAALVQLLSGEPLILGETAQAWARAALDDPEARVRESALAVLLQGGSEVTPASLARALQDHDARVRQAALGALDERLGAAGIGALAAALTDAEPSVRQAALRTVVRLARTAGPIDPALARLRQPIQALLPAARPVPAPEAEPTVETVLARGALLALGDAAQLPTLRALFDDRREAIRLLAIAQLERDVDGLLAFLGDRSQPVRFAAALQLARRGERRALPALAEGLVRRGAAVYPAIGVAARADDLPLAELSAALLGGAVSERLALVRLCEQLPLPAALRLLDLAARDPEATVRVVVVETLAARLEPLGLAGRALALRLAEDEDGPVRARAAMLLARTAPAGTGTGQAPLPRPATPPTVAASPPAGAASGGLVVRASRPLWLQLDAGPWRLTDEKPVTLGAGGHHLRTLGQELEVTVPAGQTLVVPLPESTPERLLRVGTEAAARRDLAAAQVPLTGARTGCPIDGGRAMPCLSIGLGAALQLAQLFEGLGRLGEAMTEYQAALQLVLSAPARSTPLPGSLVEAAQAGVARLGPRLGLVIFPTLSATRPPRCVEALAWLVPGPHPLLVRGKRQQVVARARETILLGGCP